MAVRTGAKHWRALHCMADWARQSLGLWSVKWQTRPGIALACTGRAECVLQCLFIPVLPPPLLLTCRTVVGLTGRGGTAYAAQALWWFISDELGTTDYGTCFLLGWMVGERKGVVGKWGECKLDVTSTLAKMCWLSPPVRLRLMINALLCFFLHLIWTPS